MFSTLTRALVFVGRHFDNHRSTSTAEISSSSQPLTDLALLQNHVFLKFTDSRCHSLSFLKHFPAGCISTNIPPIKNSVFHLFSCHSLIAILNISSITITLTTVEFDQLFHALFLYTEVI
jgi:hypothetical protein